MQNAKSSATARWLGIDFSGDHDMWGPRCTASNVWIAELVPDGDSVGLASLRRVQELPGDSHPFERLLNLLRQPDYAVSAIDAPFSVPACRVHGGEYEALLKSVGKWDLEGRRFARGATLVRHLASETLPLGCKEYRETEKGWGVNVRSAMWAGPRGGAAMTAACQTLLSLAERPIWPWSASTCGGLLAEAFPAAQLKTWNLPYQQYSGRGAVAIDNRKRILQGISSRCHWSVTSLERMLASADALDALLCALAARAVTVGSLHRRPIGAQAEGWIAVHS